MAKSYVLKLTSAVAVDGAICKAGSLVELSEVEAKNLLARGKGVLATVDDGVEEEQSEPETELGKLTKAALLDLAKKQGVEVTDGMTKAQIIAAIEAKEGDE